MCVREEAGCCGQNKCVINYFPLWLLVLTEYWPWVCPSLTKEPTCPEMSDFFKMGRSESLGSDLTIFSHLSKPEIFQHWPTHLSDLWLNRKTFQIKTSVVMWYWEYWFLHFFCLDTLHWKEFVSLYIVNTNMILERIIVIVSHVSIFTNHYCTLHYR